MIKLLKQIVSNQSQTDKEIRNFVYSILLLIDNEQSLQELVKYSDTIQSVVSILDVKKLVADFVKRAKHFKNVQQGLVEKLQAIVDKHDRLYQ